MNKLTRIIAGALAAISLTALVGCTKGEKEEETLEGLIDIQPVYVGEEVTTTDHTFKKSDFEVTAVMQNNYSRKVDNYTFEVVGMKAGVYVIDFYYGGMENEIYVPVNINFYPSEKPTVN